MPISFISLKDDFAIALTDRVIESKWQPWMEKCKYPERWIPVIPVKMLESWLLADKEALKTTFIISLTEITEILGDANPEQIPDPKARLNEIIKAGKQKRTTGYEENLAQRSRFSELEKLSSFQDLRMRLLEAMFNQAS